MERPAAAVLRASGRPAILKGPGLFCPDFCVFCMEGLQADYVHRLTAAAMGYMYFMQLAEYQQDRSARHRLCQRGRGRCGRHSHRPDFRARLCREPRPRRGSRRWLHLVQRRMSTREVSDVGRLLEMDAGSDMLPAALRRSLDAGWPVGQAAGQVRRVGCARAREAPLKMIEQVYGWDEKQLSEQWQVRPGTEVTDCPCTAWASLSLIQANCSPALRLGQPLRIDRNAPARAVRDRHPAVADFQGRPVQVLPGIGFNFVLERCQNHRMLQGDSQVPWEGLPSNWIKVTMSVPAGSCRTLV